MGKEYKEAVELLDQINHVEEIDRSGKSYELRDELEDIGFDGEAEDAFDLLENDSINCPRCGTSLSNYNYVRDVGLACGHCGNTVTDNELREILCTPECVLA